MKSPTTLSGIELATFQLITQCLNQLRHGIPHILSRRQRKFMDQSPLLQECLICLLQVIKFYKRATDTEGDLRWIISPESPAQI